MNICALIYNRFKQLGWDPDFVDAVTVDLVSMQAAGIVKKDKDAELDLTERIVNCHNDQDLENFIKYVENYEGR